MKKILFFSACLSFIIHNSAFILASERLNIAVAEFEARNVSQMDAVTISDFLRTELVKSEAFNVIDRNNMQKILIEQRFQQAGCTTQECAVKMGQILNVQRIIIGTLLKFGTKWYVNADMIDVESAKIISSEKVEANTQEELVELMEVLATVLSGKKRTTRESTKIESTKQEYTIMKTKIEGVVAIVNKEAILLSELEKNAQPLVEQYKLKTPASEQTTDKIRQLKKDVLNQMIDEKILLQETKKRNIVVTKREIKDGVNEVRKRFPNPEDFQTELKKQSLTETDFEKRIQEQLMVIRLFDSEIKAKVPAPTEEETKKLYDNIVSQIEGKKNSNLTPEEENEITSLAKFFLNRDGRVGSYSKVKKELEEYIYRSKAEIVYQDFLKLLRSNTTVEVAEIE